MEPTRQQIKEAFKETIERWEKIVEDVRYFFESKCELCLLESQYAECNNSCPVRNYKPGEHNSCIGTPYSDFFLNKIPANALAELNFLRKVYIWWMEKEGWGESVADYMRKEEKKVGCEGVGVARACGCKFLQEDGRCSSTEYCSRKSPEEKKEEWVDVTEEIKFIPDSRQGNGYYWVAIYEKGASEHFGYIDSSRGIGLCLGEEENYKIEKGKAETSSTYFRILKKT